MKHFNCPARAPIWFRLLMTLLILFLWAFAWAELSVSHEFIANWIRFGLFVLLAHVWIPIGEKPRRRWPLASRLFLFVLVMICVPGVLQFNPAYFFAATVAVVMIIFGGRNADTDK